MLRRLLRSCLKCTFASEYGGSTGYEHKYSTGGRVLICLNHGPVTHTVQSTYLREGEDVMMIS